MYGIVNKAIEELVTSNFGLEKWEAVKVRSGIDIDFFISTQPYDDEITYKLAQAVSEEMEMPVAEVLQAFGEWWVLKTGKEKYGGLMQAGGQSLKEFLINLPEFHNRIMLIYPQLTPPEFQVSDIDESSIHIHYYSKRQGLQEFVRGLLHGLGKLYNCPVNVGLLESRLSGQDHEIYKVSW
ncbi:heme NO-binding domain-containing protein [Mucilaginibacter sp. KACC 22063]|uniref:heme NO-binding domain-containing protein n=1 Tax=Mucilaginibacter sp. KACC 22063 TaxID=3025666 RepID=UPI002365E130|nr:heme NO-binding domain-containing protein [Mucilaginibacter sp. KACC 22063]WDF53951.1 heme NO-binding domain-containing protein [Mucilaginibacter sp. KACC 22063]